VALSCQPEPECTVTPKYSLQNEHVQVCVLFGFFPAFSSAPLGARPALDAPSRARFKVIHRRMAA
jgi:hypothetical protein